METSYLIVGFVLFIVWSAFMFWRGAETQKKRPEVLDRVQDRWLDGKAEVIAGAQDVNLKLQEAAEDIRARAEAEIAKLKLRVKDRL